MSLKKAILNLQNYSEQYQKEEIIEKLFSCREYYLLSDFEPEDPFVSF